MQQCCQMTLHTLFLTSIYQHEVEWCWFDHQQLMQVDVDFGFDKADVDFDKADVSTSNDKADLYFGFEEGMVEDA